MMNLTDKDFMILDKCPWDRQPTDENYLYTDFMGCKIYKCKRCGAVYAKRRLNDLGLNKYWSDYASRMHTSDSKLSKQRQMMYQIDFNYVHRYKKIGNVLDVGCGEGDFLDVFEEHGYATEGVEFGKESAEIAGKKHKVYFGSFPKIEITNKYDIIVFRGTLQYFPDSKAYLNKAVDLLKEDGIIYITALPNMNSLCFKIFKDKFTQPVTGADFIGYEPKMFIDYFKQKNMKLVGEKYFYEETPYANVENDILKVAKAIENIRRGEKVDFKSPPFYGNMMSLIFAK